MKKLGFVFAAVAALSLAAASVSMAAAPAKSKTLWEGWMDDMKKLQSDIAKKPAAKK